MCNGTLSGYCVSLSGAVTLMSFPPGGGIFQGNSQQQFAQYLQQQKQQQHLQAGQQPFQSPQLGFSGFPNAQQQQEFMSNLTPQQIHAMLNQKNSAMQAGLQGNQYTQSPIMSQVHSGMPMPSSVPMPSTQPHQPPPPPQANGSANVIADLVNKSKAGLLSPVQLAQLRAILGQGSTQPAQQNRVMPPSMPTSSPVMPMQSMPMKNTPMMMPNQQPAAGTSIPQMNMLLNATNVQQPQQQANVLQGLQFIQKIQQRLSEIDQKLATSIHEPERQMLQKNRQELLRVQGTIIQKLSQGPQMHQQNFSSSSPNIMGNATSSPLSHFAQPNFSNAPKPSMNMMNAPNAAAHMSPANSFQMPANMHAAAPSQPAPTTAITPDQFKRALVALQHRHGKPVQMNPIVNGCPIDLYQLFNVVQSLGGSKITSQKGLWNTVVGSLGYVSSNQAQVSALAVQVAQVYKTYLELFEEVWNRAMVHQMSMSNQMSKGNMPDILQANQGSVSIPQSGISTNAVFDAMMQRPNPQVSPQLPSYQKDQPSSIESSETDKLQVNRPQYSQASPKPTASKPSKVVWPQEEQRSTQSMASDQAMEKSHTSSKDKTRRPAIRVSARMLEEARSLLYKVELSLSVSRPKLPVIEDIPESEKTIILQQVEQLVSLKTTVSALLPVFLAMTQNLEPAKRVKIMIYIFEDQLALLPSRKCIMRLSDLEKLKVQMTRCIGFVRVHDEKLARKVMAKAVTDQPELLQRKAMHSIESSAENALPVSSVPKQFLSENAGKNEDGDDDDIEITATNIKVPIDNNASPNIPLKISGNVRTSHIPQESALSSRRNQDVPGQTINKLITEQIQNDALSQKSPLQFVEKAWSQLITVETQAKTNKFDVDVVENQLGSNTSWPNTSLESLIYTAIDAPCQLGFHDAFQWNGYSTASYAKDPLFKTQVYECPASRQSNTKLTSFQKTILKTTQDAWKNETSLEDEDHKQRDTTDESKNDWWSDENIFCAK